MDYSYRITDLKNEKFTDTHEKFRQINSLVFSLVKTLLSRNFCQKSVTVNFRNFHTVCRKSESIMMMFFLSILRTKLLSHCE